MERREVSAYIRLGCYIISRLSIYYTARASIAVVSDKHFTELERDFYLLLSLCQVDGDLSRLHWVGAASTSYFVIETYLLNMPHIYPISPRLPFHLMPRSHIFVSR